MLGGELGESGTAGVKGNKMVREELLWYGGEGHQIHNEALDCHYFVQTAGLAWLSFAHDLLDRNR